MPAPPPPQNAGNAIPVALPMSPGAISPRWWIASLVFHAVLITWLLFFSPVSIVDPKAKTEISHMSASQAQKVVTQIEKKQVASVQQNLRKLEDINAKMADLENRKRSEFKDFARDLGKKAPARAAETQETIAQAEADAVAALDKASESIGRFVQTRADTEYDNWSAALKLAADKQARIQQLQEPILGILSLGDERFLLAMNAQSEASAAQDLAAKALSDAQAAGDPAWHSRSRTKREGEINHYTYEIKRANTIIANAGSDFAELKRLNDIATRVLAKAKELATQADADAARENTEAARKAAANAQRTLGWAQRDADWAQKRVDNAPKDTEDAKSRLPDLEARLAQNLAQPEPVLVAPTRQDQQLLELQAKARDLQLKAQQAQEKARLAVAALQDGGSDDSAFGDRALDALNKAAPAAPAPPPAKIEEMNLAQVYETAVKTEEALTQSYRRLRAVDLTMIRRMPVAKAVEVTQVANAIRPDLKAALEGTVKSGDEAVAAREAVQTAKTEVAAMVSLASSMLSEAQDLDRNQETGATVTTQDYESEYDQWLRMQTLASEDQGGWSGNLSGDMNGGSNAAGGDGGNSGGPGGNSGGAGGSSGGAGGSSGGNSGGSGAGGLAGNGKSGVEGPFGGPGSNSGGAGGNPGGAGGTPGGAGTGGLNGNGKSGVAGPFGGTGGTSGNAGGSGGMGSGAGGSGGPDGPFGFGHPGIAGASGEFGRPDDVSKRVIPFPGRRVAASGVSARWFFPDSWYILGPFDNTGRKNLDTKFPPETIIDLNATYPGKNGVPIHWEYHQFTTPMITPPLDGYNAAMRVSSLSPAENYKRNAQYVIYYAYTEIWFEKACDLGIAVGSDDYSKLWIEDQLVWESGKDLKPMQINEGVRKVHFKQGVNRILYRVENANGPTGFSLVVSLLP